MLWTTLRYAPVPANDYDVIKLAGDFEDYRVRLSSWRLVYRVFQDIRLIKILKIERRSETTYA
ncbi:MAG TPA: hypothetical protein VGQ00_00395 [Candidatus Norongarragalinales archaeon]|jgi:mRNA-degrading endonuclease RelE of RelBE toxin-antitoxin system|nr:hypothetical protein [Candidatus Norongarragalinales archaeon]